jgi:hypothetical protein
LEIPERAIWDVMVYQLEGNWSQRAQQVRKQSVKLLHPTKNILKNIAAAKKYRVKRCAERDNTLLASFTLVQVESEL